jgi:hypothetical protein
MITPGRAAGERGRLRQQPAELSGVACG